MCVGRNKAGAKSEASVANRGGFLPCITAILGLPQLDGTKWEEATKIYSIQGAVSINKLSSLLGTRSYISGHNLNKSDFLPMSAPQASLTLRPFYILPFPARCPSPSTRGASCPEPGRGHLCALHCLSEWWGGKWMNERNESKRPNSTHLSSAIKNYTCFTNNGFSIMPNTKLQRFLRVKFGGWHHLRGSVDRQVSSKSHLPT